MQYTLTEKYIYFQNQEDTSTLIETTKKEIAELRSKLNKQKNTIEKTKIDLENNKILRSENVEYNNQALKDYLDKGIVYSNEEQIIGIDENGKKVYKRSFSGTTGSGEYITFATDYNLNNITIKKAYGSVKGQNGGVAIGGYVNSNYFVGLFIHQQELQIYYGPSLKNGNYNVTIEYTKTTD